MAASDHLGPQFFDHKQLGDLNASQYKGKVSEGVEPMERWHSMFGGTGEARAYDEGSGPTQHVEHMRSRIRAEGGVDHPIEVIDYGDEDGLGKRIKDGHHRAVAAYLEGKGAPVNVMTVDQWTRRMYSAR